VPAPLAVAAARGWGGRNFAGWGGSGTGESAGTMGRKGGLGGRMSGAEGRQCTLGPRRTHTNLHFDPQATTFLSPPGGIYLLPY
jgi:hypothetical protein